MDYMAFLSAFHKMSKHIPNLFGLLPRRVESLRIAIGASLEQGPEFYKFHLWKFNSSP